VRDTAPHQWKILRICTLLKSMVEKSSIDTEKSPLDIQKRPIDSLMERAGNTPWIARSSLCWHKMAKDPVPTTMLWGGCD